MSTDYQERLLFAIDYLLDNVLGIMDWIMCCIGFWLMACWWAPCAFFILFYLLSFHFISCPFHFIHVLFIPFHFIPFHFISFSLPLTLFHSFHFLVYFLSISTHQPSQAQSLFATPLLIIFWIDLKMKGTKMNRTGTGNE